MNAATAYDYAARYRFPLGADFHALDSETVARIGEAADAHRYRTPRNANGSRARSFYAAVCRAAAGPKWRTDYVVQQHTGGRYGWEDVASEDTRREARARLREYQQNQPEYPARLIARRVPA